jgi:GTP cyclohydrolase I
VVDHFSHRFTTQERITRQVSDFLMDELRPAGVGVVLRGEHLCMSLRGVQKVAHSTTTSALHGVFRERPEARAELMALVNR